MNLRFPWLRAVASLVALTAGIACWPAAARAAAPTACFTSSPATLACGTSIQFDASCTNANGSPITNYQWDLDGDGAFDDLAGATATIASATVSAMPPVTYGLRVTNADGSNSTTSALAPTNTNPVAVHNGPYLLDQGADLTLRATGSSASNGTCDSLTAYKWDFDAIGAAGSYEVDVTTVTHVLTWAQLQTLGVTALNSPYVLKLQVTDTMGATHLVSTTLTIRRPPVACFTSTPATVACGTVLQFNASCTTGDQITNYEWDLDGDGQFDDGSGAAMTTASATVASMASISYGLRVSTSTTTNSTTRAIAPTNTAPTAVANGPYVIDQSASLTLNGAGSLANNGTCDSIATYKWDFTDVGAANTYEVTSTTATKGVTWAQLQTWGLTTAGHDYPLRLQVTDQGGLTHVVSTTFTWYVNQPTACFTTSASTITCGGSITFDAACSAHSGPAGKAIQQYDWDWTDDGTIDSTGTPKTHSYDVIGPHSVTLVVTDNNSPPRTDEETQTITVSNRNPTAEANGPYETAVGTGVSVTATGSTEPDGACGDSIVSYAWDFNNDGTYDKTSATAAVSVTWAELNALTPAITRVTDVGAGTPKQTIRVRVTDENGGTGTDTATLAVYPTPSGVTSCFAGQSPFFCGDTLHLDAACTNPGTGTVSRYEWDMDGDATYEVSGTAATRDKIIAAMTAVNYGLRVTTTKPWGTSSTAQSLAPTNRLPTAVTTGPYTIDQGTDLVLAATGSDSGDTACGDRLTHYRWDFLAYTTTLWEYDETVATKTVPWSQIQAMGLTTAGTTYQIRLQVQDNYSATKNVTTTFVSYVNEPTACFAVAPASVTCGGQASFDATCSVHGHPSHAITTYAWDWNNDGTYDASGASKTATRAFTTFGANTVKLRVTDDNVPARTATTTRTVTVTNRAPTAVAGGPYYTEENVGVTLTGAGSTDPDGACSDSIREYAWDLNGDGVFEHTSLTPAITLTWTQIQGLQRPASPTTNLPANTITLRVTDGQGGTHTATSTLVIYRNEPVAAYSASPNPAECGQSVAFNASASSHGHPSRAIVGYSWDWDNDGVYDVNGSTAVHVFNRFGSYPVVLRVTDNNTPTPRTDTETKTIVVDQGNRAPVGAHGGPYRIEENGALALNASASTDPDAGCGDRIVQYEWDLDGNGTWDQTTANAQVSVPWATLAALPGIRYPTDPSTNAPLNTVSLRLTDTLGMKSTVTTTLAIYHDEPVALFTATPNPAACSGTIVFDAADSFHGSGFNSIALYEWDWTNDGTYDDTGRSVGHFYNRFGTYTVKLRITDDNTPPKSATKTLAVVVSLGNSQPSAEANGPYNIEESRSVTLDATGSSDPDTGCGDSVVRYEWDLNADGVFEKSGTTAQQWVGWAELSTLPYPTNPQTNSPTNTIRLRVTDSLGLTKEDTAQLRIYRNQPVAAFTATPNPAACAQGVSFDARGSFHGFPTAHAIVSYDWDFDGDGTYETTGAQQLKAFSAFGTYVVRLRVTDDNVPALTATAQRTIAVSQGNRAPVAAHGGPFETTVGAGITLDAGSSSDPDTGCGDRITKYEWDLDNNGTYEHNTTSATLALTWTQISGLAYPADPGTGLPTNTIKLRVTDTFSTTNVATTTLTIFEDRPLARFTATPNPSACGELVAFDGSRSVHGDPTRRLVAYEWDLDGNGTFDATGQTTNRTYTRFGAYAVVLRVTDDDTPPKTDSETVTVNVNRGNRPPTVTLPATYSIHEGDSLTIDASSSSDPDSGCGDRITNFELDLDGNGVYERQNTSGTFSLAWTELQTLLRPADPVSGTPSNTLALRATDTFGATGVATPILRIYKNTPTPAFAAAPNPAECGASITFDASGSRHESPLHAITKYEWDFEGDGTYDLLGSPITHTYTQFGTYDAILRVTDDNVPARTATVTRTVNVNLGNQPPVPLTGGPYRIDEGSTLTLDAGASTDPNAACGDSIVRYEWDLASDGVFEHIVTTPRLTVPWSALASLAHPASPTTGLPRNTVTLRVADEFDAKAISVTTLTIYQNQPTAGFSATPNPAGCGQTVTLDASASVHGSPLHSLVEYAWDLNGDGTYETLGPASTHRVRTHSFSAFGSFVVGLRVKDDNVPALAATATRTVVVSQGNRAPVASTGGPYVTSVGVGVTLDASASTDPDASCQDRITNYEWDVNGDGTYEYTRTTPQLVLTWQDIQGLQYPADSTTNQPVNPIALRVTDTFGSTHTATTTLGIYTNGPVACATATPNPAPCGTEVVLDASCSSHAHPNYTIVAWAWDLDNNGTYETSGKTVRKTFTAFGTYTVGLRVTDNNTQPKTATTTVTVQVNAGNLAPVANAGGPYVGDVGSALTLDAGGSADPNAGCGDRIVSYEWDLDNNGTYERSVTTATLPLTWSTVANFAHPADPVTGLPTNVVGLRVTDTFGQKSTATARVTLYTNEPTAEMAAAPNPARCNESIAFSAAASYHGHPGHQIVTYAWDFDGNGTNDATGRTLTYRYPGFGTFTAKLTTTDDNVPPRTDTATVVMNVNQGNVAPVAGAGGPYTSIVGANVVLDARSTTDANTPCGDSIVSYAWDIDADGVADYTTTEPTVTVPWARLAELAIAAPSGTPTNPVMLTVKDEFALTDTDETTLTIFRNAPVACFAADPVVAGCGETIELDAACSYHQNPGQRRIVRYEWDLDGNGTFEAQGVTASILYEDAGDHIVTLRVTDDATPALTATKELVVTMNAGGTPPIASAGGPYRLSENAGAFLTASASTDPDADCGDEIVLYEWDLDGDGAYNGPKDKQSTWPVLALQWAELDRLVGHPADPTTGEPKITINLRVKDETGATDTDTTTLAVFENQPTACFEATIKEGLCGLEYAFDASCSEHGHPDHGIVHYYWDFGDGGAYDADAEAIDWTFDEYGPYSVKLVVVDDNAPTRSATLAIEQVVAFNNTAPTADSGGPYEVREGGTLRLDASASADYDSNCDDHVAYYSWDLDGDGTYDVQGTEAVVNVPWATLSALELQRPADPQTGAPANEVTLQIRDTHGARARATTELIVYGTEPVACAAAVPNPAGCGERVVFDGACAWHRDPERSIVAWAWDLDGDGEDDVHDAIASRSYAEFGVYDVQLTVTDDSVPPRTDAITIEVVSSADNTPPVAIPGGPYAGTVGAALTLDASRSTEPNAACGDRIVSYAWDFGDDGTFEVNSAEARVVLPWARIESLPYPADPATGLPSVPLSLTVTDSIGAKHKATTTLSLYENTPVACFEALPDPARCNEEVTLDGACSYHGHPAHAIVAWAWDFDANGTTDATGATVAHTFPTFGAPAVKLTVRDDAGKETTITKPVAVSAGNRAPVADTGGPYGSSMNDTLHLDAGRSFDPDGECGDRVALYEWDLDNDGTFDASSTTPELDVPWGDLGGLVGPADAVTGEPYNEVGLRVTDSFGLTDVSYTTVSLYENRPRACFVATPNPAACGEVVTLDATCSTHGNPDHEIVEYAWDLDGDGDDDESGEVLAHEFGRFGTFRVRLRVRDDNDPARSSEYTTLVEVTAGNLAPVAEAGGPYIADVGGGLVLSASRSDEPNAPCGDQIALYQWDLNHDGMFDFQSASPTLPVTWPQIQALDLDHPANAATGLPTNPITLRVSDTFGASSTDTSTLTIYRNAPDADFAIAPNPAGCQQTVTLDGSRSTHGHPAHSAVLYQWDFENDGSFDTTGAVAHHAYAQFGTYSARLRVTDDNEPPRTDEVLKSVSVSADNRAPDAVPGGPYTAEVGGSVLLDANASSDPDAACGDRVALYAWDYLGAPDGGPDGVYEVEEAVGQRPLSWQILQNLKRVDDAETGLPTNEVRLRVTDSFGLSSVATTTVAIYENLPRPCFSVSPDPPGCREDVTLDASCTRHGFPGRHVVGYRWDFGDGDVVDGGRNVVHRFQQFGVYDVTLTVTDDNVPPRTASVVVRVDVRAGNRAPIAVAGGPYQSELGESVTLDASGSSDPDAACGDSIRIYRWDLDGDGQFEHTENTPRLEVDWFELSTLEHPALRDTGEPVNVFTLQVEDGGRPTPLTTSVQGELRIYRNAPTACAEKVAGSDGCRDTFQFSAECSAHGHPDQDIVSYEWDFDGDGVPDAEGRTVEHEYGEFGTYSVSLRVIDDNVPAREDTFTLPVDATQGNHAPVADPGESYRTFIGKDVTLDASGSFDTDAAACGDTIVLYEWDLNDDGRFDVPLEGPSYRLSWGELSSMKQVESPETGEPSNRLTLRVTDRYGEQSTGQTVLRIYGETPVACFAAEPSTVACDEEVTFDGSCSTHTNPARLVKKWDWDFDSDGTWDAEGQTVTHTYGVNGIYEVTLRVSDDRTPPVTYKTTAIVNVTLGNQPPVASAGGPYVVGVGTELALDATASYDPDDAACGDAIVAYRWDLDGDGTFDDAEGEAPIINWTNLERLGLSEVADPATGEPKHTIVLQVQDRVGELVTAEATVTVYESVPSGDVGPSDVAEEGGGGGGGGGSCDSGSGPAPAGLVLVLLLGLAVVLRRRG